MHVTRIVVKKTQTTAAAAAAAAAAATTLTTTALAWCVRGDVVGAVVTGRAAAPVVREPVPEVVAVERIPASLSIFCISAHVCDDVMMVYDVYARVHARHVRTRVSACQAASTLCCCC